MTTTPIVRVTDTSTRAEIEQAVVGLRRKQDRMPKHWVDRRAEIGDEIDALVDRWLTAES